MFWVVAVYFVGASTYSVTSELFGDGLKASVEGHTAECARELRTLSTGLHESAGKTIASPPGASSLAWLRGWDRQLAELKDRCGVVHDRQRELANVRETIGTMLRKHQRDAQPGRQTLERALDALIPSS